MSMKNIAINGFGRIGRAFFRVAMEHQKNNNDIKITHIYDVKNMEILAYLLKHDSLMRDFKGDISYKNHQLFVNGNEIKITRDFRGANIVLECSGAFLDTKSLESHLQNGINRVILSAPPKDNMPIFIRGVNWDNYNNEAIFSNASCTSNAIAPIIYAISKKYKILGGNISTIHPFNSDQMLLDNPHAFDKRLSRNATQNIIPTTSSIGDVLGRIFGDSIGRFYGDSIRVPTSLVSFSNVDLLLKEIPTIDEILSLEFDKKIIGFDDDFRVSSDFIGDKRSAIIPKDLIKINGNLLRMGLWFDNENGYANRLLDVIKALSL